MSREAKLAGVILACIGTGSALQYFAIQSYQAGQRNAALIVSATLIAALLAMFLASRYRTPLWMSFCICILIPMGCAFVALVAGEKFDRPEITVLFRSDGATLALAGLVFAGGWIVGIGAFAAILVMRRVRS